jgi:hypothetical protein
MEPTPRSHPLVPADLPADQGWCHGCPHRRPTIQGGPAGLEAHRRTARTRRGDPQPVITIQLDL